MADPGIQVKPVRGRNEVSQFIKFPFTLYKSDPHWVPPLIRERKAFFNAKKNPFFENARVELFLASSGKKVVGRIAALINFNHLRLHQERVGFFGFFESIPDFHIARALLDTASDWLKQEGMESIQGPLNFSTNQECGLLIEGFDSPPTFMMPYNPRYYPEYLERYGFTKVRDLFAYLLDLKKPQDKIEELANKIKGRREIVIRSLNREDFRNEVERIKKVYNNAWQRNWGFTPMSEKEFWWMADNLRKIITPELCLLAEVKGEVVAFSLNIPDFNQALRKIGGRLFPWGIFKLYYYSRKIDLIRGLALGVMENYRKTGIDVLLYEEIKRIALKMGYDKEEISWVLEDNHLVNRTLGRAGARVYKRYRIYKFAT